MGAPTCQHPLMKQSISRGRVDEDCLRISEKAEDVQFTHLSATYTSHTCRFDLDNNCRYPSPSKSASRGLNESYPQGRFTQLTQGGFEVGRKATRESISSHGAGHQSGPKDNTASSSRLGASATCSSAPDISGGIAGSSGQGPSEPKQEVTHLAMVVSDDDEFAGDPHQIIPTEDIFTVPGIPREDLKGFEKVTFYQQR